MSENSEWGTPQALFDACHQEFGFTIDVAATPQNAKLTQFWTKEDDALKQNWGGESVWCNPPYGRQIGQWVKKAYDERDRARRIVLLLPARTDTRWFQDWVLPAAFCVYFLRRRVRFIGAKWNAPFPSLLAVFDETAKLYSQPCRRTEAHMAPWLH